MTNADKPELLLQSRIFDVVRKYQIDENGDSHLRDIVVHPGAVVILPILDDGRIVMIENYRIAADDTLIELPAGTREKGEEPIVTARRELIEETGYTAGSIRHLTTFYSSPGCCTEEMYLYAATDLLPGEMNTEAGEIITPLTASWEQALQWVFDGTIRDAKTLVGLLYYHCEKTQ